MYEAHKDMSRAVGVKKPQEAPKSESLWENEGSQRCEEQECYDTTRALTTSWEETRQDWHCGKSTSKTQLLL